MPTKYRNGIELEYLKSILHYDPNTGSFTYKISTYGRTAGYVAGFLTAGNYIHIKINSKAYKAHRLAWFYMTGEWPENELDHINGMTDDNRWENPREAIHSQNAKNRKLNINNSTGYKGVYKVKNKFRGIINCNDKAINLGYFNTAEEAHEAYKNAAKIYHKEFIREIDHE